MADLLANVSKSCTKHFHVFMLISGACIKFNFIKFDLKYYFKTLQVYNFLPTL